MVLESCSLRRQLLAQFSGLSLTLAELGVVVGCLQLGTLEELVVAFTFTTTALSFGAGLFGLVLQNGDAITASLCLSGHQFIVFCLKLLTLGGCSNRLAAEFLVFGLSLGGLRFAQLQPQLSEVQCSGFLLGLQLLTLFQGPVVDADGFTQRSQRFQLTLGVLHRLMGPAEVVEMADNLADTLFRLCWFQHVSTDKLVEIAHGLHRDGLVEELHGLFGPDTQQPAHRPAIGREVLLHLGSALTESAQQFTEIAAEVREVLLHAEPAGCGDEPPPGLAGGLPLLEDLCEGDGLLIAFVGEDSQNHRI